MTTRRRSGDETTENTEDRSAGELTAEGAEDAEETRRVRFTKRQQRTKRADKDGEPRGIKPLGSYAWGARETCVARATGVFMAQSRGRSL
jgi:hypothetical protein